jgi:hypothetical protein
MSSSLASEAIASFFVGGGDGTETGEAGAFRLEGGTAIVDGSDELRFV